MKKVPSFLLRRLLNCGRVPIFAPQSRTKASQIGRLAQLVQSVCLTSRGSGVRIPQRPHFFQTAIHRKMGSCFFCARTKRREGGRHTQVWRSAVRKTGIDWSCRRVFCVEFRSDAVSLVSVFALLPWVFGVTFSRNRLMNGVVL